MTEDPLDTVLRLVAEGRLTADEAAPILAALDPPPFARPSDRTTTGTGAAPGTTSGSPAGTEMSPDGSSATGRTLRVEVRDGSRTIVNLRLPLALGQYAIDRVPGLSGDQVDRVKAALQSGMTGPVLVVDDEDGGVRIAIE